MTTLFSRIRLLCLSFLFVGGLSSCIDVIDLETVEVGEVLVVEGAVYLNGEVPEVKIRRSGAFVAGPDGVQQPVSGAIVTITEVGGDQVQLTEIEPGLYQGNSAMGSVGKEYLLQIQVDDNSYESLIEKMPVEVPIDELNWELKEIADENESGNVVTAKNVVVMADATIPDREEGVFLRYRVESVYEYRERTVGPNTRYCYVQDNIDFNNLAIVDGRDINEGKLVDQPVLKKLLDAKFTWGTCLTVTQHSISEQSYNYWNSIQNEFQRTGDIFESPPAKIKGNIFNTDGTKNDVIGLFSAIASNQAKIYVDGLDIDERLCQCQCWPPPRTETCYNCLGLSKSSQDQPECF